MTEIANGTTTGEQLIQGVTQVSTSTNASYHEVVSSGPMGLSGTEASISPDAGNRAKARANGIYVEIEYETSQW